MLVGEAAQLAAPPMMPGKAIDPARVGISKSLATSPCERRGYWSEHVRDDKGHRLRFPMPERVSFGAALDEAHAYIVWHIREGRRWTAAKAHEVGMERARKDEASFALIPDSLIFGIQLANAIDLFVSQPDGLAHWTGNIEAVRIQGNEGASLRVDDVIGTPDYLLRDGSVLDVKSAAVSYNESKFLRSSEMPIYAYLAAAESGVIPPRLIYQVYVRLVKPKWQWIEVAGTAAHVELGKLHAAHWRAALKADDPDLFSVDPTFCGDCPFAQPLPDVGFAGCPVGMAVASAQPKDKELAA